MEYSKAFFISLFVMFVSQKSHGQINLDRPIPVGPTDLCYHSQEPGFAYCFQRQLCRVGDETIVNAQGQWQVHFDVGNCTGNYNVLEAKVKAIDPSVQQVRVLRGTSAYLHGSKLIAVPALYRPMLVALGDILDLYGPVRYVVTATHYNKRRYKRFSLAAIKQLFLDSKLDYLGSIEYSFLAIKEGKMGTSTTMIPIYATYNKDIVSEPVKMRFQLLQ